MDGLLSIDVGEALELTDSVGLKVSLELGESLVLVVGEGLGTNDEISSAASLGVPNTPEVAATEPGIHQHETMELVHLAR